MYTFPESTATVSPRHCNHPLDQIFHTSVFRIPKVRLKYDHITPCGHSSAFICLSVNQKIIPVFKARLHRNAEHCGRQNKLKHNYRRYSGSQNCLYPFTDIFSCLFFSYPFLFQSSVVLYSVNPPPVSILSITFQSPYGLFIMPNWLNGYTRKALLFRQYLLRKYSPHSDLCCLC